MYVLRGIPFVIAAAILSFYAYFAAYEARLRWFDLAPAIRAAADYQAEIARDRFGVPHIYGARNIDGAFGLGYALAETDFSALQRAILTARGRLSIVDGKDGLENDIYVLRTGIDEQVWQYYGSELTDETRALLDAYSAGVNLYAAQHRTHVLPGFAPMRGEDIAALFLLRLNAFSGLPAKLRALEAGQPDAPAVPPDEFARGLGIAVAPVRSLDGATRLLINPQGPFVGPQAWHEARVETGEGWNMAGGVLAGAPFFLQGMGPRLGWAMVPHAPDLIAITPLETDPEEPDRYRYQDKWERLDIVHRSIDVRLWGPFRWRRDLELLSSRFGPAVRSGDAVYTFQLMGANDVGSIETLYRLNMAENFEDFSRALSTGAIRGTSFVYADRFGRIAALHTSAHARESFLTYEELNTISPASGYIAVTEDMSLTASGESRGRQARVNVLLRSAGGDIGSEDLKRYKFDNCFAENSETAQLVKQLAALNFAGTPLLEEASGILDRFDLCTDKENRGAALAVTTAMSILDGSDSKNEPADPILFLQDIADKLLRYYGRLDPQWGEVNRLHWGQVDAPLNGAPGVLRSVKAASGLTETGVLQASGGDSLTMLASWQPDGGWSVESLSLPGDPNIYGREAANLFVKEELRPLPLEREALLAQASRIVTIGGEEEKKGEASTAP